MDLSNRSKNHAFSTETTTNVLRRLAADEKNTDVLQGQVDAIESVGNNTVVIKGSYFDRATNKNVTVEKRYSQTNIDTVLKGRRLLIDKSVPSNCLVWNVDLCYYLRKEFGLPITAEDFVLERLTPDAIACTLKYVQNHPFFYGSIEIDLGSSDVASNLTPTPTEEPTPIQTLAIALDSSVYPLFEQLKPTDVIPSNLGEYLAILSEKVSYGPKDGCIDVMGAVVLYSNDVRKVMLDTVATASNPSCRIVIRF